MNDDRAGTDPAMTKLYNYHNEYNKSNYDMVNMALPKGTKDKLKAICPGLKPGQAAKQIVMGYIAQWERSKND